MKYTTPEMNIIMFESVDYIVASVPTQQETTDDGMIPGGEEE